MVGSAICRHLNGIGYQNVITCTRSELDLTDQTATERFFLNERPEYVFLAAARVGGILANDRYGADFILENLRIQSNVISSAHQSGVKKLLFLGSSCIYPKFAEQPIKEESLFQGELEPTNLPYATAKIAGKVMCDAFRRQFGFDAFTVMPSNVYGIGDNFDPEASHVVAGLMRKIHEAKLANEPVVTAWGSGSPLRELINCDDLASACVFLMKKYDAGGIINVGTGKEISIRSLAEMISEVVGYKGRIQWDTTKPDGTPRKIMDSCRLHDLGWRPSIDLKAGLEVMYQCYESKYGVIR